jgi:alanine dehydrogenase
MRVGCPKEIKNHEYRVGLTPAAVREYVAHGHEVLVETKAGAGIGADDSAYVAAGARIARSAQEVFETADMVVKVKEPQPQEWTQLREGQILYTYLHLAPDPEQAQGLLASGVTAVAYETVTDERGGLPLLAPMSEVAGRLSIQAGATALQKANGGRGVLLGGVPGVLPAKVAVIGGGVVGSQAAQMAVGPRRRSDHTRSLAAATAPAGRYFQRVVSALATRRSRRSRRRFLPPTSSLARFSSRERPRPSSSRGKMLSGMKRGAVIVDVAIDQGGCFETSQATTHSDPTYEVDGVIHYCVANMPGAVPITSAQALNNATLHHGLALADHGLRAIAEDRHLRNGLNVHRGRVTNRAVADALGYEAFAPENLLNVA